MPPTGGRSFPLLGLLRGRGGPKQLVKEGEGGRASGVVLVIPVIFIGGLRAQHGGYGGQLVGVAQGGGEVLRQLVDVLIPHAQLGEHVVHRLDAQFLGAFQAKALGLGLAALYLGDKDDRHVLAAAGTETWFHMIAPLGG